VCFGRLVKGLDVMEKLKEYGSDTGKVWGAKIVIGDCGTSEKVERYVDKISKEFKNIGLDWYL